MTTVQIIGVSVAAAAVLLLIVALVVTRRRGDEEPDEKHAEASFLDQAPQDTFSVLGKPERPVEDITLDPALERAVATERAAAVEDAAAAEDAAGADDVPSLAPAAAKSAAALAPAAAAPATREPQPGGLGLDWGPDLSVRALEHEPVAVPVWPDDPEATGEIRPDEAEITGELRPDEAEITGELRPDDAETIGALHPDEDTPPAPEGQSGGQTAAPEPARPAEGGPAAGDAAVTESGSDSRLVPLSDIIVTTSGKLVDLEDPEVRRMLTELVTFEIDQAADFRRRGQSIDAVLQLTEAEKVSRALGMTESARRIHAMMEEIRREE